MRLRQVFKTKPGSATNAIAVLALCCVFWGYAFPAMRLLIDAFNAHLFGVGAADIPLSSRLAVCATINGWRFGLAALLFYILWRPRGFSRTDVLGGTVIGLFFACGMFGQITGLNYTLPSISAFLTALVVVVTPVIQALCFKHRLGAQTWLGVGLALAGMVILSQPSAASEASAVSAPFPFAGEVLTFGGMLLFAGQILSVERYGRCADAMRVTLVMLAVTALVSTGVALCLGGAALQRPVLAALVSDRTVLAVLPPLVIFSSVLAMAWMNAFQPRVNAATACVVYCIEPVFGTIFSVLLGLESLHASTLVGGLVIVAALLVVGRAMRTQPPATATEAQPVAQDQVVG